MSEEKSKNILLGAGVVEINNIPIGLTRGGSVLNVERETRAIEADGDRGPVKGRIAIDTETAKLTVNALEMFSAEDITKYYSGTKNVENVITSKLKFDVDDYVSVKWTGKTLAGNDIIVTIPVAINMENLELSFEDKNEVVVELAFTGVYAEDKRDESTWTIEYPQPTTPAAAPIVEEEDK